MNLIDRLKLKKGILRGTLIVTISSLLLTSCVKKKENLDTAILINVLQNDIILDNVLEINDALKITDIQKLEKYLEISEKINSLNLSIMVNMDSFEMSDNPVIMLGLIDEYTKLKTMDRNEEENERLDSLEFMLYDYGTMVNNYIKDEGQNILIKYGYLVAKSLVLDSCGLPIDNIDIIDINIEDDSVKIGAMTINACGLKNVFEVINKLIDNDNFKESFTNKYSANRNKFYKNILNELDKSLLKEYYYRDGKILTLNRCF